MNPYAQHVRHRDSLTVAAATPTKIVALIRGLTPRQLTIRPAPGKWSILEKWAAGRVREREPLGETLERFRLLRRSQVRLFRRASKTEFRRTGFHPERGVVTLREQLETLAGHDLNHLAQIQRLAAQHEAEQ